MQHVCKINMSLSDQPLYVSINDPDMTINSVFEEAIKTLNDSGRCHEAQQIQSLYKDHQVSNKGKFIGKGDSFKSLILEKREINGDNIYYGEIDLLKQHVGGFF